MSSYQEDILAQPAALQNTLDDLATSSFPDHIQEMLVSPQWKRIILTGMGSSFFALYPLYRRLLIAGKPAWLIETSELIYMPALLTTDTLIIAASQSGTSVETTRLLGLVDAKAQVIGISNTADSPLTLRAAHTLVTRAGAEVSVSCKTYLAALAAQVWLGDRLLSGENEFEQLNQLPLLVKAYLEQWQDHIVELIPLLREVHQIFVVGRGISVASAGTGGLTLKESTRISSEGMSSAAFRHGPIEMAGPGVFVVVFAGNGETALLNRKLWRDVAILGGRGTLVDCCNDPRGAFDLPWVPTPGLPMLEILPVQMITLALAAVHGFTAGSFNLASKITTEE